MNAEHDARIDELLAERARYEGWLIRLAHADAPPAVRERVRRDYEARLATTLERLRGLGAMLGATLQRHRDAAQRLERQRDEALDQRAEAELRYRVGEYGDDEWQLRRREFEGLLERVQGELARELAEVQRLEGVQQQLDDTAPPAAPEPAREPAPGAVEELPAQRVAPADKAPRPRLTVEKGGRPARGAAAELQELAFLKGIATEVPTAVARVSAPPPPAAEVAPAPVAPPAPHGSAPTPERLPQLGAASLESAVTPVVPVGLPDTTTPPGESPEAERTLVCGECGTANVPTEWYCERCGAELASI